MDKERMSVSEMTQYRERLMRQKEFLTDILSKIEKQIFSLQVERLHLRNTLLGIHPRDETVSNESVKSTSAKSLTEENPKYLEQELDLSLLPFLNDSEEENEDEELTG